MADTTSERVTSPVMPGVVLAVVAAVAFVVCLAGFAAHQVGVGVDAAIVTLSTVGVALAWLTAEARRVRAAERQHRTDV